MHEVAWCNNSPLDILGVEQLLVQQTKWFRNGVAFRTSNLSYASSGTQVAGSTGQGGQNYQLRFPQQVQVVGNNMYIVDRNNNRIIRWAIGAGSGTVVAGGVNQGPFAAMNRLRDPRTVIADNAGNMYILDRNNHRVLYWPAGAPAATQVVAGGNGSGIALNQLKDPSDMALYDGALYIADEDNHRVVKWVIGEAQGTLFAGQSGITGDSYDLFNNPVGIDVDADGSVYVVDMENNRVLRFDPGETMGVLVAGGNGIGIGLNQLWKPYDVQVDAAKNIFVVDRENHRIMKYEPFEKDGIVVAGGNGEGNANNQFDFPTGFFIKGNRIYVADNNNHRIMRWNINLPAMSKETIETVQGDADYHVEITMTDGTTLTTNTENFTYNVVVADYAYSVNNLDLTVTNNSIHGETYSWNFNDGVTSSLETPSHHYRYNGTYNVCLTTTDSCSKSDVHCESVVILAPLNIVFAAADLDPLNVVAGCGQRALTVRGVFVASDIQSIDWKRDGITYATTGAGDSTHITDGTGDYTAEITFVDATTLTTPTIRNYIQDVAVSAGWTHVVAGAGDFRTTTFTNTSTANTTFVWNFGDATPTSTDANPVHVYANPGTYSVSLTATDSCGLQDVSTQNVTIDTYATAYAAAALSIPSNLSCSGQVTISVTGISDASDVSTTQWFKDAVSEGAASAGLTNHLTTTSNNDEDDYTATIIFTDGSTLTTAAENFELVNTVADFSWILNADVRTVDFTNASVGGISYSWDFGDASPASTDVNPTHVYTNPGTYNVVLSVTNSCGDVETFDDVVVVPTYATAAGVAIINIASTSNCENEEMTLVVSPLGLSAVEWFKNAISEGSSAAPDVTQDTDGSGTYTATASFADGSTLASSNSISFTLTLVVADWSQGLTNLLQVGFINASSNGVSYSWDFDDLGNTSTDPNPTYTFSGAGTYSVCLTTTDACGNTHQYCNDVTVVEVRTDNPNNNGTVTEDRSQLGMHEWEKAISLYPNPTSTVFNLELTGLETAIQLMDVNGRLIAQREGGENQIQFDLSNFAKGMYMIVIATDQGVITKRVMRN